MFKSILDSDIANVGHIGQDGVVVGTIEDVDIVGAGSIDVDDVATERVTLDCDLGISSIDENRATLAENINNTLKSILDSDIAKVGHIGQDGVVVGTIE